MAAALFTRAIVDGTPVKVFNFGRMRRDFTYIDDVVEGVVRVLSLPPVAADAGAAPYAIYNIGNHTAIDLESFIGELEQLLGKRAIREYLPPQPGDVPATFAAIDRIATATGFAPTTSLGEGLRRFVAWYLDYYRPGGPARAT
jgi:UDP-glucuronate 4-epimerase